MTKFCALVDLASDAAFAVDGNSRIVACNRPLVCLLGYAADETLGRPCYEVLQAILPNGEPLCTPACEGKNCFDHRSPFSVHACSLRRKGGEWQEAGISTLIAPPSAGNSSPSDAVAIIFLHRRGETTSLACGKGRLRVYTLGRFGLSVDGCSLPTHQWHRKQALTLLKLLVAHDCEAVHRDRLIECLWSDADERRGRERLKVTTYFLREQLRTAGMGGDIVTVTGSGYALKRDAIWLDCETFKSFFKAGQLLEQRGRPKDALVYFEQAERLYSGDYLPDDLYADWCAEERECLREIYLDVLAHLVDGYLDRGDYERAAEVCHLGLAREPYREGFHRALMICLARLGQREQAVAHYRRCRQILEAELGVEPAPETERVYREVVVARRANGSGAQKRR